MKVNIKQLVLQVVIVFAVFAVALFGPIGTIHWPAGWIFLAMFFGFSITLFTWLFRHNPGLLRERMRMATTDQQSWDKALFPLLQVVLLGWLAFMSLDAARFHWSTIPIWGQVAGGAILLSSFYYLFLSFRENSYLSPVVRVQKERGQEVISTGPYHYVRHPMYSAILVFILGTSLLLGSGYGLLIGLLGITILARRAILEERMLLKNLHNYANYKARVKYRMIPYVW